MEGQVIVPFFGPMTALGQQKKHRSESCAGMTVESMVAGVSMPRNDLLFNNAIYLLPYTGAGSGLRRAMDTGVEVQFDDNEKTREFVITLRFPAGSTMSKMHHQTAKCTMKMHHQVQKRTKKAVKRTKKMHHQAKKRTN